MAEKRSGPSTATIALIALIATPVVLFAIFALVGSGNASASSPLPDVVKQGLAWAQASAKTAGYDDVTAHDALGRDRGLGDTKDWKVCFRTPLGKITKPRHIELGVVKVEEHCPSTDQGLFTPATTTMPDLKGMTAFVAGKTLGDNASVRYLDPKDNEITRGLGNWQVCTQNPAFGAIFNGVPVAAHVVPYGAKCSADKG